MQRSSFKIAFSNSSTDTLAGQSWPRWAVATSLLAESRNDVLPELFDLVNRKGLNWALRHQRWRWTMVGEVNSLDESWGHLAEEPSEDRERTMLAQYVELSGLNED